MKKILYKDVETPFFESVWNLYEDSFPMEEKRTLSKYKEAILDERFFPYIYEKDSKLLALLFYWEFEEFYYVEHFAVIDNLRGNGIGSLIISEIGASDKPVILEIEPPVDEFTKKRLHFYQKNRFVHSEFSICQLKYRKENKDMFLNLVSNTTLSQELYEKFDATIHKELSKYCE